MNSCRQIVVDLDREILSINSESKTVFEEIETEGFDTVEVYVPKQESGSLTSL